MIVVLYVEDITWPRVDKKFFLRVLKNISRVTAANEIPNHFTLIFFFALKGAIYHVAIATVIFHV